MFSKGISRMQELAGRTKQDSTCLELMMYVCTPYHRRASGPDECPSEGASNWRPPSFHGFRHNDKDKDTESRNKQHHVSANKALLTISCPEAFVLLACDFVPYKANFHKR